MDGPEEKTFLSSHTDTIELSGQFTTPEHDFD
jgi:hypothetical protein